MSKRLNTDDGEESCSKRFKVKLNENECDAERIIELKHIITDLCRQQHNLYYQWCKRQSGSSSSSLNHATVPASNSPSSSPSCSSKEELCDNAKTEELADNANLKTQEDTQVLDITTDKKDYDRPNLMSLSDDVLLLILKNLHPFDLLNISRTSVRLNTVCRDRTLWADIDFRHDINDRRYMKRTVDFDHFFDFLLPVTRSIKKSGSTNIEFAEYACVTSKTTQVSITSAFIQTVSEKAPNLKSFTIENHTVYGPSIPLECFSPTLEHLSFKNSIVIRLRNDKSYFFRIDQILPNIKILDLTGCQWFDAHSFLALSKSATLKELHLKGCLGIEDCVPYASLAATFGFQSLELLDLRLTHVSDSEVACFTRVKRLKKLYLEALDWPGGDSKISDIGVVSFGKERESSNDHGTLTLVVIKNRIPSDSSLETLVLRNYRSITDISLKHSAGCLPTLKYLDVRGTSCTELGVIDFKRIRPEVELLSDFSHNFVQESAL